MELGGDECAGYYTVRRTAFHCGRDGPRTPALSPYAVRRRFRKQATEARDDARCRSPGYPRHGSWTAPRVRHAWCLARHNEAE